MRSRAIALALISIVVMSAARCASAIAEQYDSTDLANYEATPYGIDLPDWYGEVPFFLVWARGDGQAFVTLAADPLMQGPSRELGNSLYRFGRVGYSILGRVLVGWQINLIPVGLFLVNLIGVGVLGWIAGLKLAEWGPRSLLLPFNPAVYIAITGDTAEILGLVGIVIGLMSANRIMDLLAGILLGSTRPSYATAALIGRRGLALTTTAVGTGVGLQLLGYSALGLEWVGTAGNLTIPPLGYVRAWSEQPLTARAVAIGVLIAAVLTLIEARHHKGLTRLAFISTALLAVSLQAIVVGGPRNILRAAGAMPILWIVAPSSQPDRPGELVDRGA